MGVSSRPRRARPAVKWNEFDIQHALNRRELGRGSKRRARGLRSKFELALAKAVRGEVCRLLSLRTRPGVSFWAHLGRQPDKFLSSSRSTGNDIAASRCLRFKHEVLTVENALDLLDAWHGHEHKDDNKCTCDPCSSAMIRSCVTPRECRTLLVKLFDAKVPPDWDGITFPRLPDDQSATARSIFQFTLGWNGMAKSVFDTSMCAHFVHHFKRVTPLFASIPDPLITDIFVTYAGSLHRKWAAARRGGDAKSQDSRSDSDGDHSDGDADAATTGVDVEDGGGSLEPNDSVSFDEGGAAFDSSDAQGLDYPDSVEGDIPGDAESVTDDAPAVETSSSQSPDAMARREHLSSALPSSTINWRIRTSDRRRTQIRDEEVQSCFEASADDVGLCFDDDATSDVESVKDEDGRTVEYKYRPRSCRSPVFTAVVRMLDHEHQKNESLKGHRRAIKVNHKNLSHRPDRPHPLYKPFNWYDPEYIRDLRIEDPLEAAHLEASMKPSIRVDLNKLTRVMGIDRMLEQ